MDTTQRTRPLTEKQRHVLSVLADGGVIVHHSGVRGRLISTRLFHSVTEAHAGLFSAGATRRARPLRRGVWSSAHP